MVSIVIIGRNESANLLECIQSVRNMNYPLDLIEIMYVDTDSTDGSPEIALSEGILVFEEHSSFPSAGRARNRGWREAKNDIVHFVDGDMTIDPDYLKKAVRFLGNEGIVCVIGRLKERYANENFISGLLEYPWKNRKPGFVNAPGAGGTFLKSVLLETGGYNPDILKGQESELGARLSVNKYRILMIDQPMGTHDYEVRSLKSLWSWYSSQGRSYARILNLEPSEYLLPSQIAARRLIIQGVLFSVFVPFFLICGLWWVILITPVLLAIYIVARYWQPIELRKLRIMYFMFMYFFKPAIWWGMSDTFLRKKTKA